MKLQELLGDWSITKRKLKEKVASLTDGDVLMVDEKQNGLVSRLQVRLGKTKEEVLKMIADL
jgi:uncharacterized protein YjbJ (UPF0337 family)